MRISLHNRRRPRGGESEIAGSVTHGPHLARRRATRQEVAVSGDNAIPEIRSEGKRHDVEQYADEAPPEAGLMPQDDGHGEVAAVLVECTITIGGDEPHPLGRLIRCETKVVEIRPLEGNRWRRRGNSAFQPSHSTRTEAAITVEDENRLIATESP